MVFGAAQTPFVQAVDIEVIDLGTKPPAIGGVKSYSATSDEATMECTLMWGSDARVRVSVRVGIEPLAIYIPAEVSNIQARPLWLSRNGFSADHTQQARVLHPEPVFDGACLSHVDLARAYAELALQTLAPWAIHSLATGLVCFGAIAPSMHVLNLTGLPCWCRCARRRG